MRVTVVDKNNLQTLTRILSGKESPGSPLEQLRKLNPHVDFKQIEPGTVLLIPDTPVFREAEGVSVTDTMTALSDQIAASIEVVTSRVRAGHEALLADQKEVAGVLKLAAVKRALESDPELKTQIDAATQVYKQDQQQAADGEKALRVLQLAKDELSELSRLIG